MPASVCFSNSRTTLRAPFVTDAFQLIGQFRSHAIVSGAVAFSVNNLDALDADSDGAFRAVDDRARGWAGVPWIRFHV